MKVARLLFKGIKDQAEIAKHVGVNASTVSRDITWLERRWRKEYAKKIDDHRSRVLAEIAHLKQEMWDEWERSKQDAQKVVKRTTESGETVTVTVQGRTGNYRYAQAIKDFIDQEIEILGLAAPLKVAETDADGESVYTVEMMQEIMRLAEEVGEGVEIIDQEFIDKEVAKIEPPKPEN